MKKEICNKIRAGYPGLYVVSHEEQRACAEIQAAVKEASFTLYSWSLTQGMIKMPNLPEDAPESIVDTTKTLDALNHIRKLPESSVVLMRDFHLFLIDRNPIVLRTLKDSLLWAKCNRVCVIILGCTLQLVPEIEKELTVINFSLPDRATLRQILWSTVNCKDYKKSALDSMKEIEESLVDSMTGLTTMEAEDAVALSIIEMGEPTAAVIMREKCATLKKGGLLEVITNAVTLDDVGGLENLKRDLLEKRNLFTPQALAYGIDSPRGILALGQPGTGKSLVAKASRSVFNLPLLRLDAGKLFGSLIGQSEQNWRIAFATLKAMSPCIGWIDEVDGLTSGHKSSGQTDSGVTNRVIKMMLTDMQENSAGIFWVCTANDIDNIPDAFVSRLDCYSVDFPTQSERESILRIHIDKRKRKPKDFDCASIAKELDGFSGRQIEQVWLRAMTIAFNDHKREPRNADLLASLKRFTAEAKTMKESLDARRVRLANRCIPASAPEKQTVATRKLAA